MTTRTYLAKGTDRLLFRRRLPDGSVLAVNIWASGYQHLVYPSFETFEAAKRQVEEEGRTVPYPCGYRAVGR